MSDTKGDIVYSLAQSAASIKNAIVKHPYSFIYFLGVILLSYEAAHPYAVAGLGCIAFATAQAIYFLSKGKKYW